MAEKILALRSGRPELRAGEFVTARLDGVMAYESFVDTNEHLIEAGLEGGIPKVWNTDRFFLLLEHVQPAFEGLRAERAKKLRALAERLRVTHFHDVTLGICHQIMCDNGYVRPGQLLVGSDSHCVMYGALNAAGTGLGESDMAYAVTFGEVWFQVPETIQIVLQGSPPDFPIAKDIMLWLAGGHGDDFAQYKALEFIGTAVPHLSIESRMCLADHSVEVGAKFGLFGFDERTAAYLAERVGEDRDWDPVASDDDASVSERIEVDLSTLAPQVAMPHSFDNVRPVTDASGTAIDQAVIGSCANGRFEDIEVAARILKGRRVHPKVRFLVSPASWGEYLRCVRAGFPEILIEAGAQFLDPGCGVCAGRRGHLGEGESCITSTTRNYQGRMGSPRARIFLGGPATVAASALRGVITDPREVLS